MMQRWMMGLAALAAFAPGVARADWEYTKWGMTPKQVVQASNGAVRLDEEGAKGTFSKGSLNVSVVFDFRPDEGLVCVIMSSQDPAQSALLKETLLKSYGRPQGNSNTGLDMIYWEPGDIVEYIGMATAAADARHCKKGYGVLH